MGIGEERLNQVTSMIIDALEILRLEKVEQTCGKALATWSTADSSNSAVKYTERPEIANTVYYIPDSPKYISTALGTNPCDNICPTGEQQKIKPGGNEEMPRPLKYGQGSITKRIRISYCDENGKRRIKTTSDDKKAKQLLSQYEGSKYSWYEAKWLDEYGKRHAKTCKTKEDCYDALSQFNKRSMKNPKKNLVTFGVYMREWYDIFRKNECGAARNTLNLLQISRIPETIMDKPLGQVSAGELQQYLNTIKKPHPKVQTKELMTACIRHAFGNGKIKINIGASLIAEVPEAPEKPTLPREREQEFLNLLTEKYQWYAIGLIYTGVRLGEFMRLNENWQTDIDYKSKIVKIRETKSLREKDRRAGKHYVIREIPLLPELTKLKFPLPKVKQKTINKNFTKAAEKFGINLTPHCMRHTFITRCDELGINETASMSWTGHKSNKIHKKYKHKTTKIMTEAAKKLMKSTPISTPLCTNNDKKRANLLSKSPSKSIF